MTNPDTYHISHKPFHPCYVSYQKTFRPHSSGLEARKKTGWNPHSSLSVNHTAPKSRAALLYLLLVQIRLGRPAVDVPQKRPHIRVQRLAVALAVQEYLRRLVVQLQAVFFYAAVPNGILYMGRPLAKASKVQINIIYDGFKLSYTSPLFKSSMSIIP